MSDTIDEFDAARLIQVLAKYLEPQSRIEVFNNLQLEGGGSFVLFIFSPEQPRPVIATCEGTSVAVGITQVDDLGETQCIDSTVLRRWEWD